MIVNHTSSISTSPFAYHRHENRRRMIAFVGITRRNCAPHPRGRVGRVRSAEKTWRDMRPMYCVIDDNRRLSTWIELCVWITSIQASGVGLLPVIAIRGRPVKGHSLAALTAARR
jgi:hypothetical protein